MRPLFWFFKIFQVIGLSRTVGGLGGLVITKGMTFFSGVLEEFVHGLLSIWAFGSQTTQVRWSQKCLTPRLFCVFSLGLGQGRRPVEVSLNKKPREILISRGLL